ncbi:FemAB family XrtA/PEP-CTERM system-associated protein [Nitratidesulfovibrio vulgaris]|uniref:FemAB family XrtA/PEP-CTERM system-associated protein n=1 Tax=Nitratidesulfovibrio vulgaris TaxID=881 RepID=UPI0013E000C4|nr:FemAB family XrtA/PEP-CTERM system-associated protein [Nitratidesulfovibrio vulgaris]
MSDMEVRGVDPNAPQEAALWDAYVAAHAESTGYHRMGWTRVAQRAFGHAAYPLAAFDGGRIAGVLPLVHIRSRLFGRFLVSLPFVNYGGLLADSAEAAQALIDEAEGLLRRTGAGSIELRHVGPPRLGLSAKSHKVTMLLDLPDDPDTLWRGLRDKVRNQVRKAGKSGLTVEQGGAGLLGPFYDVFAVNMRDLGTPVYSRCFFETIMDEFPGATRIVAVRDGDDVVAAALCYTHGNTFEVPWASSLRTHRDRCPNNLMYWHCMETACREGFTVFDFGRSSRDSGPWRFKAQWGAREVPLSWEYLLADGAPLPDLNPSSARFSLAVRVWRHLPVALTRFIGPHIVRSIP